MDIAHMSPDILIESYEPGHSVAAFCGAVLEAAAARAAAARTSPLVKRSSSKQIEDTHKRGAKLVRSLSGKVPQVHFSPLTITAPPV
jgi:hypothetical protein